MFDSDDEPEDTGSARKSKKKPRKSSDEEATPRRKPGPKSKVQGSRMGPSSAVKKESVMTPLNKMSDSKVLLKFRKWCDPHTFTCEICESNPLKTTKLSALDRHLKDYHGTDMEVKNKFCLLGLL